MPETPKTRPRRNGARAPALQAAPEHSNQEIQEKLLNQISRGAALCAEVERRLAGNPAPSRSEIVEAISANICRCTGYAQIVEAVALAAERMRGLNQPARNP